MCTDHLLISAEDNSRTSGDAVIAMLPWLTRDIEDCDLDRFMSCRPSARSRHMPSGVLPGLSEQHDLQTVAPIPPTFGRELGSSLPPLKFEKCQLKF